MTPSQILSFAVNFVVGLFFCSSWISVSTASQKNKPPKNFLQKRICNRVIIKSLSVFFLLVFSCSKKQVSYNYPDNQDYARQSRAGRAFSIKDLVAFGNKKEEKTDEKKSVKNDFSDSKLWLSSVDVISALFPIAIIDASSGIIATEWYQENPQSKKRIKINALIKGKKISEENLRISVFRQVQEGGEWRADGVEDSEGAAQDALSAKLIKEKILAKARL